jgi:hypothetical protein
MIQKIQNSGDSFHLGANNRPNAEMSEEVLLDHWELPSLFGSKLWQSLGLKGLPGIGRTR